MSDASWFYANWSGEDHYDDAMNLTQSIFCCGGQLVVLVLASGS
jgi:hypothetical protein